MKLNKAEFMLMNNPLRNIIQEHIEIKRLRKLSDLSANKTVLEIGCGTGNGSKLIKKYFKAKRIYSIDLDKKMIDIAKKRNVDSSISFDVQDATKLKYDGDYFDAIFDLGVVHHIPNWRDCLRELKRVLKPEGQLILEDLSTETFSTPFGRLAKGLLDHPYDTMYARKEFSDYLKKIGFKVKFYKRHDFLMSYFIIIAQK